MPHLYDVSQLSRAEFFRRRCFCPHSGCDGARALPARSRRDTFVAAARQSAAFLLALIDGALRRPLYRVWYGTLLILCCYAAAQAAETSSASNNVLHAAPGSASAPLAAFRVSPGFKVEVVAQAPLVTAPVAIAFDENGRLFVAEMRDYPDRGEVTPHLGRVRVLTDPDSEGVFQTSTVYAEDLRFPSAICCYAGGVFVLASPDLLYFRDSHGEGTADLKRSVLSGFGDTNAPNVQRLPNSLTWGLDNRIYGVTAGSGGVLTTSNWPSGPVSLAGSDFSFDPRSLEVFRETGPAQSGLTFNDVGRRFVSDFSRPFRLPMYDERYTDRNPFYPKPAPFIDVASPATAIFEAAPPNSSKAGTASGEFPSTSQTNLLVRAWLGSAHGCLIYRGRAFPTNYYGNAFIPDPDAHVVHRIVLRESGLGVIGERPRDELNREFLMSSDPSFRPVQALSGPDGALYIVDMKNGRDAGAIYRIVPTSFKRPKPPELGKARTYDLVAALAGADGWYCDTAGRLLYEHRDPGTVPLLTNMLANSRLPLARLRALHALGGMHALSEADIVKCLHDPDARVREAGVQGSEQLITNGVIADTLWTGLKALAADPEISVRYQLAFTAGEVARVDKAAVLAVILQHDLGNLWIRNAVLSSVAEGAGNLFVLLAGDVRFRNDPAGQDFLRQLAVTIGTKGQLSEVQQVIGFLGKTELDRLLMFGFAAALGEGLHNTRSSLALADPQGTLQPLYTGAFQSAIDSFTPLPIRIQALRLVAVGPGSFADTSDWLLTLCNPQPSADLRAAAIAAVARYDNPGAATGLIDRWPVFEPALRSRALNALLMRRNLVPLVIAAVERGRISAADFSAAQLDFLRTYDDPAVNDRALRLFGPLALHRPAILEEFKPALHLHGIPETGRATFAARCSGCHRLEGVGLPFGPDLLGAKLLGKEKLLTAILEPSATIASGYETSLLQTLEGENLMGIKTDDNPTTVTLRQVGGGSAVYPRLNVKALHTAAWSLMPPGLEQGLSPQGLADLLEYLMTVRRQTE